MDWTRSYFSISIEIIKLENEEIFYIARSTQRCQFAIDEIQSLNKCNKISQANR